MRSGCSSRPVGVQGLGVNTLHYLIVAKGLGVRKESARTERYNPSGSPKQTPNIGLPCLENMWVSLTDSLKSPFVLLDAPPY